MTSPPPTFFSLFFSLVVSLSYWTLHILKGSLLLLLYRSTRLATTSSSQKGKLCGQSTTEEIPSKNESSVDSPRQKRYLQKGPRNWDRHARSSASPPPSSPQLPPPLRVARRALSGAGGGKKDDDAATLHIPHHNGRPQPTVTPS